MKKKEFKSSSKRVLDLMINSIYTNKEIFLRELISNASDAIDKLAFEKSKDAKLNINPSDFKIFISVNKSDRTITISDNGIGMDEEELDKSLGTIAESGSLRFKEENPDSKDSEIIGQFGVGFYSAFMVSKKVEVISKKIGSDDSYIWTSEGIEGYTIGKATKKENGTEVSKLKYNLYLEISDNSLTYSTASKTPELLLNVYDPDGNEVKEIEGLKYVTIKDGKNNEISGFDITEGLGRYYITKSREISTTNEITEKWDAKVTYVNLKESQDGNLEKVLNGLIRIEKAEE